MINESYWALPIVRRRDWINHHVILSQPKRRTYVCPSIVDPPAARHHDSHHRNVTRIFFLPHITNSQAVSVSQDILPVEEPGPVHETTSEDESSVNKTGAAAETVAVEEPGRPVHETLPNTTTSTEAAAKESCTAANETGVEETATDVITEQDPVNDTIIHPAAGNRISVCQKMFLATLGYTTDACLLTVKEATDDTGIVHESKRGKHAPKHKLSQTDSQIMEEHIKKYNPCISHYRRENAPNRLYLPSELSIQEMYNDYKLAQQERNTVPCSYSSYQRAVSKMNISFAKLGVEECEDCDRYAIHRESSVWLS